MSDYSSFDWRSRRHKKKSEEDDLSADDLFSASGSNTDNKPQTGLFGSSTTPNANQTNTSSGGGLGGMGSMLGGLGTGSAATTQPQSGGLFSSSSQPQQQQLGGIGGATSQPAQTGGSMFSGLGMGSSTQQQQQPQQQQPQQSAGGTGGLFPSLSASTNQQQAKPSPFGGLGQSTAAPSGGGML